MATLGLGLNTAPAGLLLAAAWLRETPLFWRNAGGFPVALRELVHYGFLPGLVVDGLLVGAAVLALVRHRGAHRPLARFGLLLAALQAMLLTAAVLVVLANNLDNFINGRPVHWKPVPAGVG